MGSIKVRVVRGVFIKHRSRLKKDRLAPTADLSTCISNLEKSHKLSQSPTTKMALSDARLIQSENCLSRTSCASMYYVEANKPGQLLARELACQNKHYYHFETQTHRLSI